MDKEDRIFDALRETLGDTAAAERKAEGIAIHENVMHTYRKLTQAWGRGIRDPHDVIKLGVIFDIRFPVPDHVVATRRIARNGGDPTRDVLSV